MCKSERRIRLRKRIRNVRSQRLQKEIEDDLMFMLAAIIAGAITCGIFDYVAEAMKQERFLALVIFFMLYAVLRKIFVRRK